MIVLADWTLERVRHVVEHGSDAERAELRDVAKTIAQIAGVDLHAFLAAEAARMDAEAERASQQPKRFTTRSTPAERRWTCFAR